MKQENKMDGQFSGKVEIKFSLDFSMIILKDIISYAPKIHQIGKLQKQLYQEKFQETFQ